MSRSNVNCIPLNLSHIDIFTFGESILYGYDCLNHCLIVISLNELTNLSDQSIHRFYLSFSPINPIVKLIVNEDETIVALLSDRIGYLVYFPQSLKGCHQCSFNVIPCSSLLTNHLIDFIWLSSNHLMVVNSDPSSSECHLYRVRSSKSDGIEFIQTFPIGFSSSKGKRNETSRKKLTLCQSSDIVKLDSIKRQEENSTLILLFALKSDGEIYLMKINENQLMSNENALSTSFEGPIILMPWTLDNYGSNYRDCRIVCMSNNDSIIILFTRDKCSINQCIYLNPFVNDSYLYTIDSIDLTNNGNNPTIKSLIIDQLNSNIYYVLDSSSNVYSIELSWINEKRITNVQHLVKSNGFIYQIGLIQTNDKGQCLTIISKSVNPQIKELIFVRPHYLSLLPEIPSRSSVETIKSNSSLELVERIRTILHREESFPQLTLSSSSPIISQSDFEENLSKLLTIFLEEYFSKQERARIELENRHKYLQYFQETQIVAQQELQEKFKQIQQTFEQLNQRYEQESERQRYLQSNVDDVLSVIEQRTPVVSDEEMLMHRQMIKYQIQINSLKDKISLLEKYLQTEKNFNRNEQHIDPSTINHFQTFAQYFTNEIDLMKQRIQTIDKNN